MSVLNCQYKYNDNKPKHILFLTKFNKEVFTLFIYVIYICLMKCLYVSCTLSLIYFLHDICWSPIVLIIGESFIPSTQVQNTYGIWVHRHFVHTFIILISYLKWFLKYNLYSLNAYMLYPQRVQTNPFQVSDFTMMQEIY